MLNLKPWDVEPDLKLDRLVWIARCFAAVRKDARLTYEPLKGDGPWGFGCKCYERQVHAIESAANSDETPWLSVVPYLKKFIFRVGGVPAKFYKGEVDHPRKSLRNTFPELRQRSLPLTQTALLPDESTLAWCFAVETDDNGLVTRVSVAAHSIGEDVVLEYEIPFDEAGAAPIVPMPVPPPVPIAPPVVSAPAEKKKASDDTEDKD